MQQISHGFTKLRRSGLTLSDFKVGEGHKHVIFLHGLLGSKRNWTSIGTLHFLLILLSLTHSSIFSESTDAALFLHCYWYVSFSSLAANLSVDYLFDFILFEVLLFSLMDLIQTVTQILIFRFARTRRVNASPGDVDRTPG
jgi:hypothetical protein